MPVVIRETSHSGFLQNAVDKVASGVESVDDKAQKTGTEMLDVCIRPPLAHSYCNMDFEYSGSLTRSLARQPDRRPTTHQLTQAPLPLLMAVVALAQMAR